MAIPLLETASIGRPITRVGVSLFPVYLPGGHLAVTSGRQAHMEISENMGGSVPELVAANSTNVPVLLVDGETVVGGRQNRILNVSVLVPAGRTVVIPVSCIEQGRWDEGRSFRHGRSMASRRVRRAKIDSVERSVRRAGDRRSDQTAVWQSVAHELHRLDMVNASMSFDVDGDAIRRDAALVEATDDLLALGPLVGQCGIVVAHGRRIVAADIFGHPDVLVDQWDPLVRSYLLDAPGSVSTRPSATRALRFLSRVAGAESVVHDGVGLGQEHHVRTPSIVGQALVLDGQVVHASAFALAA